MPSSNDDRSDSGDGDLDRAPGNADEKAAYEELDRKVAEVTTLERKLAALDELEQKIAELKKLEYELDHLDDEDEERHAKDGADLALKPKPLRPRSSVKPTSDDDEEEDTGAILREYRRVMYQFSFIGIEFGVAVALGFFGGRWLDGQWGTAPWMMLLGVALGLTAAGRDLYRLVKKAQKKAQLGDAQKREASESSSERNEPNTEPRTK